MVNKTSRFLRIMSIFAKSLVWLFVIFSVCFILYTILAKRDNVNSPMTLEQFSALKLIELGADKSMRECAYYAARSGKKVSEMERDCSIDWGVGFVSLKVINSSASNGNEN